MVKLGRVKEGMDQAARGLDGQRKIGATNITPYVLALFAEILGDAGRQKEGLATIQEALEASRKTGLLYHEAEIHRIQGELMFREPTARKRAGRDNRIFQDIEACFLKSLRAARKQQAKSFELRATTSLARLWANSEQEQKAGRQLHAAYRWFSEGFETADLKDARELLGLKTL
jgi:predicted ATPase